MSNISIEFENISKQYRLGTIGTGTLSHDLNRWWHLVRGKEDPYLKIGDINDRSTKATSDYVWALKDVSFKVEQGEVLGIIGKNGAGKSTLLKILSRVTTPSTGIIKAKGRIASLLEVGTGFHGELSGRENIYMNGAILGMTKHEITRKLDEIVAFSGIERYIDTPVKRYSSGMTVRLGFAVAAHLEPEILVVDEVLAVGDAEFQKKAIGKMKDVSQGGGRTVLFVSHNMGAIETLCTKAAIFKDGMLSFSGNVSEAVDEYIKANDIFDDAVSIIEGVTFCHSDFKLDSITINNSESNVVQLKDSASNTLDICLKGELKAPKKMVLEARLYDLRGSLQGVFSPGHVIGIVPEYESGKFEVRDTIVLPDNITKGEFLMDLYLTQPNIEGYIDIPQHIKIITKGVVGATGLEFEYRSNGLLMLK